MRTHSAFTDVHQIFKKSVALPVIENTRSYVIVYTLSVDKTSVLPIEIAVVKALRLDPERWICTGASLDFGDIPLFSDDDPDKAIVDTTTDQLRSVDCGSFLIGISMKSGLRHVCPDCGTPSAVKKYDTRKFNSSPIFGMKTKVSVRVPQLYCRNCNTYRNARCPLVVRNHTYTKLLKLEALSLLSQETISAASEDSPKNNF